MSHIQNRVSMITAIAAATFCSTPAICQVYIINNDAGEQILLDLSKGEGEATLLREMRRKEGSNWGLAYRLQRGECMVWQSFKLKGQPKQYFRERYVKDDRSGKRQAMDRANAKATAANPARNPGIFGEVCSTSSGSDRTFDFEALEKAAGK